jgi:putative transposase
LRIEFPGTVYHVTSRGNERKEVFRDDADRFAFLAILHRTVERWRWPVHACGYLTPILRKVRRRLHLTPP